MNNSQLIVFCILLLVGGVVLFFLGVCLYQATDKKKRIASLLLAIFGAACFLCSFFIIPIANQRWGRQRNLLLKNLRENNVKYSTGYNEYRNAKVKRHHIKIQDGCDLFYWELVE